MAILVSVIGVPVKGIFKDLSMASQLQDITYTLHQNLVIANKVYCHFVIINFAIFKQKW